MTSILFHCEISTQTFIQEPIYTPRILRSEQRSSPRHDHQQQQQMQFDPNGQLPPVGQPYQFHQHPQVRRPKILKYLIALFRV